jgi:osmoprotectant transport system ATP-binding protein
MIRVEGLTKHFGSHPAVRDFRLNIKPGELCVLLGPSGCGKSTALRLLNRLIEPEAGTVFIGGRDTRTIPGDTLRRDMGYVIQSIGLFPHYTVFENIAVVPRLKKWEPRRVSDRVAELLEMTGLPGSYAGRYPRQLSGGEAQRVGVARALAADPEVLLMDEPFGALDLLNRRLLQREFKTLQERLKTTVLFVTHDVDEALELAETMAVMRDGLILQKGLPEDFLHRPADPFIPEFLGPDYGLKLLGRYPLAAGLKGVSPGGPSASGTAGGSRPGRFSGNSPDGKAVFRMTGPATMKDALAFMVTEKAARLTVVDGSGVEVGTLDLKDILNGGEGRMDH